MLDSGTRPQTAAPGTSHCLFGPALNSPRLPSPCFGCEAQSHAVFVLTVSKKGGITGSLLHVTAAASPPGPAVVRRRESGGTLGEGVCGKHMGRRSGPGPLRRGGSGGWPSPALGAVAAGWAAGGRTGLQGAPLRMRAGSGVLDHPHLPLFPLALKNASGHFKHSIVIKHSHCGGCEKKFF